MEVCNGSWQWKYSVQIAWLKHTAKKPPYITAREAAGKQVHALSGDIGVIFR